MSRFKNLGMWPSSLVFFSSLDNDSFCSSTLVANCGSAMP